MKKGLMILLVLIIAGTIGLTGCQKKEEPAPAMEEQPTMEEPMEEQPTMEEGAAPEEPAGEEQEE